MKTLVLFTTIIKISFFLQEIPPNNPSYKIHNYKHLNKAILIAKRDTNKGIRVSKEESNRDYKKVASKQIEKVLIIENKDKNLKRVNYKMPNK